MNRNYILLFLLCVILVSSCSKKKETRTIITKIEYPKLSKQPKAIGDEEQRKSFEWGGVVHEAVISRKADKEQDVVKDEDGQKYYDNAITLRIDGALGKVYEHTFRKGDFASYIDTNYLKPKRSVLMSIVYNKVEGNNAVFVANISSPDTMADQYMLVRINISKTGGMTMQKLESAE